MGSLILKAVSKRGHESLPSQATSLFQVGAKTIDGSEVA